MYMKTVPFSLAVLLNMYDVNIYVIRHPVLAVVTDQEKTGPLPSCQNIKLVITIELYFVELIFCCCFTEIQRSLLNVVVAFLVLTCIFFYQKYKNSSFFPTMYSYFSFSQEKLAIVSKAQTDVKYLYCGDV